MIPELILGIISSIVTTVILFFVVAHFQMNVTSDEVCFLGIGFLIGELLMWWRIRNQMNDVLEKQNESSNV